MIKVTDDGGESVEIELDEEDLQNLELRVKGDITKLSEILDQLICGWDEFPISVRIKLGIWCQGGLMQLSKVIESGICPPEERN
jgi:hypothetical protein